MYRAGVTVDEHELLDSRPAVLFPKKEILQTGAIEKTGAGGLITRMNASEG
jgi:hypothetical protein